MIDWRFFLKISACVLCAWGLVLSAVAQAERLYGFERLERFDLLPCLFSGTQVRQVSSHDRTGWNDDGFDSTYSYLYEDSNGEFVIFDEKVPGCLYRVWMTFAASAPLDDTILRFYFDGHLEPDLSISVQDFFDGDHIPFISPMVGNRLVSSGGYYSYYPFPYAQGLKVTVSRVNKPFFYHMTYHRFDSSDGIESWTGTEDGSEVVTMLDAVGGDPKSDEFNTSVTGRVSIADGASEVLFSDQGTGVVQALRLDLGHQPTNVLSGLRLVMNWDGGSAEVDDVPVDRFFLYHSDGIDARSLPLGMNSDGECYCYFPMPFWMSAQISLRNESGEDLSELDYEIEVADVRYDPASSGYFYATYREKNFVDDGQDYTVLDVNGRGHLVGVSLFMIGLGNTGWYGMGYLEGDERIYIDGNASPAVYGTGTEDYFNGGWYFNQGEFSLPYHGSPYQAHRIIDHDRSDSRTLAYRFHIADTIPFYSSLKFGIEHGSDRDLTCNAHFGTYSSVAYYYKAAAPLPGPVLTLNLDLNDAWSESLCGYGPSGAVTVVSNRWSYEGDHDDVTILDSGYLYDGASVEFTVPLVEHTGVTLRRRTDLGRGRQTADIFVDGMSAGIWCEADDNFDETTTRWMDSEFMISTNLTAGKDSVQVRVVPHTGTNAWNDFSYQAYCIPPFCMNYDSDEDGLPDEWELEQVADLNLLSEDGDADGDGTSDYSEWVAGTHPMQNGSFFRVTSVAGAIGFKSEVGRLYSFQQTTNLLGGTWQTFMDGIPGNGQQIQLPVHTDETSSFFRVRVTKQ